MVCSLIPNRTMQPACSANSRIQAILLATASGGSPHALLDSLGVTVADHALGIGHQVAADGTGRTAAAGVWVAGNAADVTAGVMRAAASGVTAAAAINADLTAEDTTAGVAARRATLGTAV
jgi:NADPH-dependent glutamate synthase beta subunit-like oxidoreductase